MLKAFDNQYTTLPDLAEALDAARDDIDYDDRLVAIEFLSSWRDFKDAADTLRSLMNYHGINLKE